MFFGTANPNLRSILKPEVELMVFLRMRSNKNVKNAEKRPQNTVLRPNFPRLYVFRHVESEFQVHFETEVELIVFLRMRSHKITKNAVKCP